MSCVLVVEGTSYKPDNNVGNYPSLYSCGAPANRSNLLKLLEVRLVAVITKRGLPKIRGAFMRVPIIRIVVFRGLY